MKSSKLIKAGAIALAAVVIGSGVAGTAYAKNSEPAVSNTAVAEESGPVATNDALGAKMGEDLAEGSVYVFADASGKVQKLTVKDAQSGELKDYAGSEAKLPVSLTDRFY